jgi:hypothetical protein
VERLGLDLEQLELVVVQLDECRRLLDKGGTAYLRLALILIDNAVEVIMFRRFQNALAFNHVRGELLKSYDESGHEGPEPELVAEARETYVPKTKRRDIERSFGEKVDFLVQRGLISASIGAGLHKLHNYRNEAYHRDKLRTETMAPAVRIYFDMGCTLLADFDNPKPLIKKMWDPVEFAEKHPGITKYASLDKLWHTTDGMPRLVSERLLAEVALDVDTLRDDLMTHLRGRISEIEKELAVSQWSFGDV